MSEDIWFTSDTHFFHDRIQEFCPNTREGEDAVEMTWIMVDRWNKRIKPGDRVYHTGDFSFKGKTQVESVASVLNGQIHLVLGNHDHMIKKNPTLQAHFASVSLTKHVKIGDNRFILSHFPFAEWWDCHKGTIHLFGHLHGNKENVAHLQQYKAMDIGVDTRSDKLMVPYHIDEVLSFVKNKDIMNHH